MKNKLSLHSVKIICLVLITGLKAFSQASNDPSVINPLSFGVVLDDPAMKSVIAKKDITYLKDEKGSLAMDIYSPPGLKGDERRPAIIFLNAIGERPGERKVKSWGIYSSWPTLMAAKGYIGISMETDGNRIQESIKGLFDYIEKEGARLHIDANRLGVYAASANVTQSLNYLMSEKVCKGIKAAVLYYGFSGEGPFRKDLPVLYVVSEGDVRPGSYANLWNEVLKNNAPWTIKMGTGMPHAFDAYADNDEARKIIKETIGFWKDHLDPVPQPLFAHSKVRDVFGLLRMDREKGLEILKTIVDENPNDTRALLFYADVLREAGKTNEAETVYLRVLTKQPANTEALVSMTGLSIVNNKPAEAEKYIAAAVSSGNMTSNYYGNLGFTLLVANKNKEAAIYYQKAVELSPNGHDFYNLACAYAKSNDADRAIQSLALSLQHEYGSRQQIDSDTDFDLIRSDEKFKKFVATIK